jgi:transcriptional regulator with XRE-family HTH domain
MENFYTRVNIKLAERNRKRSWLLSKTGIRPSTWSSWVTYDRMPPADKAIAIADALDVSPEFLITGRETPFDARSERVLVAEILQRLEGLSDRQLRRVLTAVNTIALEE